MGKNKKGKKENKDTTAEDANSTPPVQEEAKAEESQVVDTQITEESQVVDTQTTEEIKPDPPAQTKPEDKPEDPPVVEQPAPVEEQKQAAPVEAPKPEEEVKAPAQEEEKPAVQISMDSLKQPDPPAESQDSFVKLDASMTSPAKNVKEAPSAVQNDYLSPSKQESSAKKRPGLVGIQGFQEQTNYSEIESPMRKRKGALQKLKLDNDSDEDHAKQDFAGLEKAFNIIMSQLESKKKEFETIKTKSLVELRDMHLQDVLKDWQRDLEMKTEGAHGEEQIVKFNQMKKDELKQIEEFVHIFSDWVDEKTTEISNANLPPAEKKEAPKKPAMTKQSSKLLEQANLQTQAKLKAQLEAENLAIKQKQDLRNKEKQENDKLAQELDQLQEDEDLMRGLEECEKLEKKQLEEVKKTFTPRGEQDTQGQGQGEQQKPKTQVQDKKDSQKAEGDSNLGALGVGLALVVVAGTIAYRYYAKK